MSNDPAPIQVLFRPDVTVAVDHDGTNARLHDVDFMQSIDSLFDPEALGVEGSDGLSYDFEVPAALAASALLDPKLDAIKDAIAAILAGKTVIAFDGKPIETDSYGDSLEGVIVWFDTDEEKAYRDGTEYVDDEESPLCSDASSFRTAVDKVIYG